MKDETNVNINKMFDDMMNREPLVIMNDADEYIEIMDPETGAMYEDYSYAAINTPQKLLLLVLYLSDKTVFSAELIHELLLKCSHKFNFDLDVTSFDADAS